MTSPLRGLGRTASCVCLSLLFVACSSRPQVSNTPAASATPAAAPAGSTAKPTETLSPTVAAEPTAPPTSPTPTLSATPAVTPTPDPWTHGPTMPRGALTSRPWMVMIDNHPDAYPQSGMDGAAIVFEALAEFGITRYIATYADGITPEVNQIGPVRSTRAYFAQWAMGFRAIYVHAGGSPDGLQLVQSTDQLVNFEALNEPKYGFRDTSRRAPHNLYTTSELIRAFAAARNKNALPDPAIGYLYAPAAPVSPPEATALNYYFADRSSAAGFRYDAAQNIYLRTVRNKQHIDRVTGKQLWTNNVVIIEAPASKRPGDDKARIDQEVIGFGAARIFMDGKQVFATWRKPSAGEALKFFDAQDQEISFSSGSIWIAAIPSLDRLSVE